MLHEGMYPILFNSNRIVSHFDAVIVDRFRIRLCRRFWENKIWMNRHGISRIWSRGMQCTIEKEQQQKKARWERYRTQCWTRMLFMTDWRLGLCVHHLNIKTISHAYIYSNVAYVMPLSLNPYEWWYTMLGNAIFNLCFILQITNK